LSRGRGAAITDVKLDPEAVDRAEREIERFIEKQADKNETLRLEASWKLSDQRRQQRQREQNRKEWGLYYATLAESLALRAGAYSRKAQQLLGEE
jgi:hypothetical protein